MRRNRSVLCLAMAASALAAAHPSRASEPERASPPRRVASGEGPDAARPSPRPPTLHPPTLEELRDLLVRHGVPSGLVRIEEPGAPPEGARISRRPGDVGLRRLVFWTKTRELTQTVIVAVIEGPPGEEEKSWVRVQSADLARVPEGHPGLPRLMAYMLDRNFAMTGAQFARDASDGEVVVRADLPCAAGVSGTDFVQAVESVLRAADEESARVAAVLSR